MHKNVTILITVSTTGVKINHKCGGKCSLLSVAPREGMVTRITSLVEYDALKDIKLLQSSQH